MTAQEILAKLVSIDSVSARSNVALTTFLADLCQTLNLRVRQFPYRDENAVEKINLIAISGSDFLSDLTVELALVGHTDTVPYDPDWTEALTLTERDGKLYGRGACDTKAYIAAALAALGTLQTKTLGRPFALIFTADEEVGLMGAKRLADLSPLRAHYSIVGEPTSLQPMRAGKGYCLAEVKVKGDEAHSAYPSFGASAIFRAGRLLTHLERIAEELHSEVHTAFDPPYTTLNVGVISGGTAKNVVAGECRFTLEWRPVPGQQSDLVLRLLNAAIKKEQENESGFTVEVQPVRSDQGFETSTDSRLVEILETTTGRRAGTVAFGTEAGQMIRLGAETVVLGPGDIRVAHRTGEFVPIEQLNHCSEILKRVIQTLCG
ncbi:MAG TPA: acetylornithine deacetylase [Pyrinomonadaceae bacterium]|nr:acetylornithine deacetylase [Pyrinomonadaceae bacterium]